MRIGKGACLYILSRHYVSERGKYGDKVWSLLGKDKDHDRRISFIIRRLVWKVWPFCDDSSAHYIVPVTKEATALLRCIFPSRTYST